MGPSITEKQTEMTEHCIFSNGESIKIVDGIVVEVHTIVRDGSLYSTTDYQYRGETLISVKFQQVRVE